MRKIPKALLLDTCVCDGTERAICEFVKSSMQTLCFDAPVQVDDGSGLDDYGGDDEDFPQEPEYVSRNHKSHEYATGDHKSHSAAHCLVAHGVVTLLASILALLPLR